MAVEVHTAVVEILVAAGANLEAANVRYPNRPFYTLPAFRPPKLTSMGLASLKLRVSDVVLWFEFV